MEVNNESHSDSSKIANTKNKDFDSYIIKQRQSSLNSYYKRKAEKQKFYKFELNIDKHLIDNINNDNKDSNKQNLMKLYEDLIDKLISQKLNNIEINSDYTRLKPHMVYNIEDENNEDNNIIEKKEKDKIDSTKVKPGRPRLYSTKEEILAKKIEYQKKYLEKKIENKS